MTDQPVLQNKASDAALEYIKQLNVLSSGIIALSATFLKEIPNLTLITVFFLLLTWVSFLVSIITGLKTIQAIIQSRLDENEEWSSGKGLRNARYCRRSFIAGIILFIILALFFLVEMKGNLFQKPDGNFECVRNCLFTETKSTPTNLTPSSTVTLIVIDPTPTHQNKSLLSSPKSFVTITLTPTSEVKTP